MEVKRYCLGKLINCQVSVSLNIASYVLQSCLISAFEMLMLTTVTAELVLGHPSQLFWCLIKALFADNNYCS